jgi:hypothetical protein
MNESKSIFSQGYSPAIPSTHGVWAIEIAPRKNVDIKIRYFIIIVLASFTEL